MVSHLCCTNETNHIASPYDVVSYKQARKTTHFGMSNAINQSRPHRTPPPTATTQNKTQRTPHHTTSSDMLTRMPVLAHGVDRAARDGLGAAAAHGARVGVIVQLAIGLALVLEEGAVRKRLAAVLAHEALHMPRLIQRIRAFAACATRT